MNIEIPAWWNDDLSKLAGYIINELRNPDALHFNKDENGFWCRRDYIDAAYISLTLKLKGSGLSIEVGNGEGEYLFGSTIITAERLERTKISTEQMAINLAANVFDHILTKIEANA